MKKVLIFLILIVACMQGTQIANANAYQAEQIKKLSNYDDEDVLWLARNIYFESRSEKLTERIRVAFVTMNRVTDERWPNTITAVVRQPRQFSWYNDRVIPKINEINAWKDSLILAEFCINLYTTMMKQENRDTIADDTNHYFADYIKAPVWAAKMEFAGTWGRHLFYKD